MTLSDVRHAHTMPLVGPAYPRGPYRFIGREFLVLTYRTDPIRLRAVVPEPLDLDDSLVCFEFIRMPDSSGFGSYTESGQVIPVVYQGVRGHYVHAMYLNNQPAIAAGRELWGFPKKWATPRLLLEGDTLIGTLDYGSIRIATATMGFKHTTDDREQRRKSLLSPNFLLRILPNADGSTRTAELVRYFTTNVEVHGVWGGPGSLELHPHALAPASELPVLQFISATHYVADLTLTVGEVVFDYLAH